MAKASTLADFLLKLEKSRAALARYKKDPAGEMRRFGLSKRAIAAMGSGNIAEIRRILHPPLQPEIPVILWVILTPQSTGRRRRHRRRG